MDLKYQYWQWQGALSDEICDKIIKLGKTKISEHGYKATVGTDTGKLNEDIRKSSVCWFNDQWLYDLLCPYVYEANVNAGWNFDIENSEDIQFTEYKKNGYYSWHSDGGSDHHAKYSKENTKWETYYDKVRKLSMTVNLSHKKNYEGGDLLIKVNEEIITCKEAGSRGSIVVFPSFYQHKISPITKGVRNSLVMWTLGKPFK